MLIAPSLFFPPRPEMNFSSLFPRKSPPPKIGFLPPDEAWSRRPSLFSPFIQPLTALFLGQFPAKQTGLDSLSPFLLFFFLPSRRCNRYGEAGPSWPPFSFAGRGSGVFPSSADLRLFPPQKPLLPSFFRAVTRPSFFLTLFPSFPKISVAAAVPFGKRRHFLPFSFLTRRNIMALFPPPSSSARTRIGRSPPISADICKILLKASSIVGLFLPLFFTCPDLSRRCFFSVSLPQDLLFFFAVFLSPPDFVRGEGVLALFSPDLIGRELPSPLPSPFHASPPKLVFFSSSRQ